jgi:hypothetical protein
MTVINVCFTLYYFYIFLCLMTCSTSYCLVTVSGIPGMYSALYCIVLLYKYESCFVSQKFKIHCQLNVTQVMHCIKTNTQFTTDFLDISIPHLTVSVHTLQSHIYVCVHTLLYLSRSVQSVAVLSL